MAMSGPIRKVAVEMPPGGQRRVVWGRAANGRYHGEEFWEQECDERQQSKFQAFLRIAASNGVIKNEEHFRYPLKGQGNLGEFKIFKKRLYFYRDANDLIVTHGATKKRNETDREDIDRANRIKSEIERQEELERKLRQGSPTWGAQRGKGQ